MELVHVAALTLTSLVCVSSYELTVRGSDLHRCGDDDRVCVNDLGACGPPPPVQETLNVSCYYQPSQASMTCEWSEDSPEPDGRAGAALVFNRSWPVLSCRRLFIPAARLTVRLRRVGVDSWSQPHPVFVYDATKPPPPEVSAAGATVDSVDVTWRGSSAASCRLRYRAAGAQTWSQVPDVVSPLYTITGLLPFTAYVAAVACRKGRGLWSDWSAGVSVVTRQRAPGSPPQVCHRLENTDAGGRVLHLRWKALDPRDAGGHILGYQVSYGRVTGPQPPDTSAVNVTEEAASLQVGEGNWSVSVTAFNAAGHGPAAHLSVDTQAPNSLPSVRNLWVSSSFPAFRGLSVRWSVPAPPPTGRFDVVCQWRPESGGRWSWVDGSSSSALIQDVDPEELYLISVFTVHQQQCGPAQSLSASLQHGALMEPGDLQVTGTNRTAATVMWAWQRRRSGPIRVDGYRVTLRSRWQTQTWPLWPGRSSHTFLHLTPNTEYSLVLLADDAARVVLPVRTDFDEVPLVATTTPLLLLLLLLAVTVATVSVLSSTVYKGFLLPRVCSPRDSGPGRWLMDPNRANSAAPSVLDIKDFQETDVLGVKSDLAVEPRSSDPQDEPLVIRMSDLRLDAASDSAEQGSRDGRPRGSRGEEEHVGHAEAGTCGTGYIPNVAAPTP